MATKEELEDLRDLLPEAILKLSREEQDAYLQRVWEFYREQEKHEQEELKKNEMFQSQISNYPRKHEKIYKYSEDFFDPDLLTAIKENQLNSFLTPVTQNLYSCPFFTQDYCRLLLEEIENFELWAHENNIQIQRPNSMNNYGVILDLIGFSSFLGEIVQKIARPIGTEKFREFGGDSLDSHHGFVVEYQIGKDKDLDFHVDDSEVTLNICLGKEFSGGGVYFGGIRCAQHQGSPFNENERIEFPHKIGVALFHAGSHRHGATPITSGFRSNLILWCRSSKYRNEVDYRVCPDWCGYHNVLPVSNTHHHHHHQHDHQHHQHQHQHHDHSNSPNNQHQHDQHHHCHHCHHNDDTNEQQQQQQQQQQHHHHHHHHHHANPHHQDHQDHHHHDEKEKIETQVETKLEVETETKTQTQ